MISEQLSQVKQDQVSMEQSLVAERQASASLTEQVHKLQQKVEQLESSNQPTLNMRGEYSRPPTTCYYYTQCSILL